VNPIKKAPVTSLSSIEAVVGFVLTFLATHHILGSVNVSSTTQTIAPFVALALPALFGAAKWALVSPVSKVESILARDGVLSDADIARINAAIADQAGHLLADAETVAHPTDVPDSANAGAPTAAPAAVPPTA
jgi:hypothetical protein